MLNIYKWAGKKHFVPLSQSEARTRDLRLSIQAALITAPGARPLTVIITLYIYIESPHILALY